MSGMAEREPSLVDMMSMALPSPELREKISALLPGKADFCLQCARCTSGCTAMKLLELKPHEIVALVRLGFLEELISSKSIWDCALCLKCVEKCPQEVAPAEIIMALRNEAVERELEVPERLNAMLMSILETGLAFGLRKRVARDGRSYGREDVGLPEIKVGLSEEAMMALMELLGGA